MSAQNDNKKRAADDLESIARLKKNPDFTGYFQRRVSEQVSKSREKVLHDTSLTKDQLYEERLRYLAALETSKLMEEDEAGCRNILGTVPD